MQSTKRSVHQFALSFHPTQTPLLCSQQTRAPTTNSHQKHGDLAQSINMSLSKDRKNIKALALSCRQTFQKTNTTQGSNDCLSEHRTPTFTRPQAFDMDEKQNRWEFNNCEVPWELQQVQKIRVYKSNKLVPEHDWFDSFFLEDEESDSESELTSIWVYDQNRENIAYFDHQEEFETASEPQEQESNLSIMSNCSTQAPHPSQIDKDQECLSSDANWQQFE